MPSEIIEKWIAALRSGEYKQEFNCLRKGDCFCAIGVLCDIVDPTAWEGDLWHGQSSMPAWAWEHISSGSMWTVITWNDRDHLTFDQIAEKLEAWYG